MLTSPQYSYPIKRYANKVVSHQAGGSFIIRKMQPICLIMFIFSFIETSLKKLNIKPFISMITIETIDGRAKPNASLGHLAQSRAIWRRYRQGK